MKRRCYAKNDDAYPYYGARGITICDEWLADYEAFKAWSLGYGYADDLTIDRIDGDKGYSPDNCRWVTRKVQQNNLRSNRLITYEGETRTVSEWSEKVGIKAATLSGRLNYSGYSNERALTEPTEIKHAIGEEAHTLTKWVDILGLKYSTVANRISRGMDPAEALTKPVRKAARNYRYTFDGKTLTLKEWAALTGLSITTLHERIRRGWSVERMLTEPNKKNGSVISFARR
jgi:hypothetical protein